MILNEEEMILGNREKNSFERLLTSEQFEFFRKLFSERAFQKMDKEQKVNFRL